LCLVACAGRRLTAGTRGRSANRDPPESPGSSLRNDPPWWDSQGLGSPAPRSLGRRLRGARPRPIRVGSTRGPTTASCDRACPCLGAWRGQDDGSACSRGPRDGCGQGPAWGCTERRVRRWPSRGRRLRCRARAGRGRLCDQGRPCCCTGRRERGSGAARVSATARLARGPSGSESGMPRRGLAQLVHESLDQLAVPSPWARPQLPIATMTGRVWMPASVSEVRRPLPTRRLLPG
jgi:hypothetical protein